MVSWKRELEVDILSRKEASSLIGDSDDFYVYIIWKMYVDPPIPFYVGKGHMQRLIRHEMKSDENNNIYKTRIIQKYQKLDIELGYSIYNFFEKEEDALLTEIELIQLVGRADLENGPLSNKTDGGDGTLGHLAPKGGDSHSARPVIADNIKYSCLKDASIFLEITSSALMARIRNGWPGYYYEDEGQRDKTKKILGRYKKAVSVEGKKFGSLSEAGEKTGYGFRQIAKRIKYGWPGYYYLDEGQLPKKTIWGSRKDKVPVIIRGKSYSTVAEAVNATGESTAMISKRCLSSNFPEYSRLDGKVDIKETAPKFPEEVMVKSQIYESLGKAADSFNITDGGVAYRCRSNNYPEWQFTNKGKQKKESFTPEFSSNPVSVFIDGIEYDSQSSAAKFHGVDINTVKSRCRSYSFPAWTCEGVEKSKPKKTTFINIKIEGKEYISISLASRELGYARDTIKKRLESDDWSDYSGILIKP